LVGVEVELAKGNLLARLHFFWFIAEVEDNSHLKHDISLYAKGPYLVHKLLDYLALAMPSNVIAKMELNGSTRDTRIYTGSGHGGALNPTPMVWLLLYLYAQLQGLLLLAT
jgi:hypothetical protein